MTGTTPEWTVQRLELLYFNHNHKWQLFQQTASQNSGIRGEAGQRTRFRRQIAALLMSVESCLTGAGLKVESRSEAHRDLLASAVKKDLKGSIEDLRLVVEDHIRFVKVAGLTESSKKSIVGFLNSLLSGAPASLKTREDILDLMSVIQLESSWEIPVLFLPYYILKHRKNDPRTRTPMVDFLKNDWRRFYVQSLWFTDKCPTCTHESCLVADKRISTAFATQKTQGKGKGKGFILGSEAPLDYHELCIKPSKLVEYKFYSHVVDSAWEALNGIPHETGPAFVVGYPLQVLGRTHILQIHLVPSNGKPGEATIQRLFNFWQSFHMQNSLEECCRYVSQQIKEIDIAAFQWHFADALVKAASSLKYPSPIIGDTLSTIFCSRARDAFLITSATASGNTWTTNDKGDWVTGAPVCPPEGQAVVVNEQVSVTIPALSSDIESLNLMHREYGTQVLQMQWQWALSFAQMPQGSWKAWTENPDAERQELLMEMVGRACVVLSTESRQQWGGALRGDEVLSRNAWVQTWIPQLASNSPVSPAEVFDLPWDTTLATRMADAIKEDFRTLAANDYAGLVLKHPANGIGKKPTHVKSPITEGLRKLEFRFPGAIADREDYLLTKIPGFGIFNSEFENELAKQYKVLDSCKIGSPKHVSVILDSNFTIPAKLKWNELGRLCGIYVGDIALINRIADQNKQHSPDNTVNWAGFIAQRASGASAKANRHEWPAVFEWSSEVKNQGFGIEMSWATDQFNLLKNSCELDWQLLDTDSLPDVFKIILYRYRGTVALWNHCSGIVVKLDEEGKLRSESYTNGPPNKFVVCCAFGSAVKGISFIKDQDS